MLDSLSSKKKGNSKWDWNLKCIEIVKVFKECVAFLLKGTTNNIGLLKCQCCLRKMSLINPKAYSLWHWFDLDIEHVVYRETLNTICLHVVTKQHNRCPYKTSATDYKALDL